MIKAREIEVQDIPLITDYWLNCTDDYLIKINADPKKMPNKGHWFSALQRQIKTPYSKKQSFGTIWLLDNEPIGHCNINTIKFGQSAYMHLHVWKPENRKRGIGNKLVIESLHLFFSKFELDFILCEPYAENLAPHEVLDKIGFEFIKEYTTIPGAINYRQSVKQWKMTKEKFNDITSWNND